MNTFIFNYAYLFGSLIFFIIWLPIYLHRKDLRKELIFAGILGSLFAATDILWIPYYWNPPFLFDLIHKVGFSIEDVLIGFFEGGIAAVLFEFIQRKKERRLGTKSSFHFLALVIFFIIYIGLSMLFPERALIAWCVGAVVAVMIILFQRKDLIIQVFIGGLFFMIVYFLLFELFLGVFPYYISTFYNLKNFWQFFVFGLPLEEIVFAFCTGMLWSVLYEYTLGYRTRNIVR